MLFNSIQYIYVFLPITIIVYFLLNYLKKYTVAKLSLIVCSLIFYSFHEIRFLPLILGSIIFNYNIANYLNREKAKFFLVFGIIINILILCIFKYTNFVIKNLNLFVDNKINFINLIFPIALSFFTLQQITYLVNCYEEKKNISNFVNYSFYVTFFPQLVAGPIILFYNIKDQFDDLELKKIKLNNLYVGLFIIFIGLFKKVILVDHLSTFVDNNFYNYESLNFYSTWITSISFSLQFYYDFSSYSDIAIGSALLLNFNIPNNFNSPLRSTSIIDFWQRWHISLSNFINHYMYIPILKNIKNFNLYKNFFVILFIMTVIGLWHGPNYTYIIFGALHGIGLGVNHIFRSYNIKINKILSWIITINFVNITFVFFRSENHQQAIHILKKMFYFKNYELIHISDLWSNLSYSYIFIMVISLVGITLKNTLSLRNEIKVNYLNSLTIVFFAVTTLFYLLSRFGFENKFIYLQF